MKASTLITVTFLVFLTVFVGTAAIALASLPGWVHVGEPYQTALFSALVLQVVGCIIGFIKIGIPVLVAKEPLLLTAQTLTSADGWDWQWADENWRTEARFQPTPDGRVTFRARTSVVRMLPCGLAETDKRMVLYEWESTDPFEVPENAQEIQFEAKRAIRMESYRKLYGIYGKRTDSEMVVRIRLRPSIALAGTWWPEAEATVGRMVFTTALE